MREGEKMKIRLQKGTVRITREGGREVRVAGIPGSPCNVIESLGCCQAA